MYPSNFGNLSLALRNFGTFQTRQRILGVHKRLRLMEANKNRSIILHVHSIGGGGEKIKATMKILGLIVALKKRGKRQQSFETCLLSSFQVHRVWRFCWHFHSLKVSRHMFNLVLTTFGFSKMENKWRHMRDSWSFAIVNTFTLKFYSHSSNREISSCSVIFLLPSILWKTANEVIFKFIALVSIFQHFLHLFWSNISAAPTQVFAFARGCSGATFLTCLRLLACKCRCSLDQLLLNIQTRMIKKIKLLKIFKSSGNFRFVCVSISSQTARWEERRD